MPDIKPSFIEHLKSRFADAQVLQQRDEVSIEVDANAWHDVVRALRDEAEFAFEQLTDLCGVDYLSYGEDEWDTADVSSQGFSRGVEGEGAGRFTWENRPRGKGPDKRFAVVAHLISYKHNQRLRVRCFAQDNDLPVVASVTDLYPGANWFEREAFDLFGIVFSGHPDLRRILTDYGFVGYPFRKDFPLIGNVEVRYDSEKQRVVYEPVSIDPRVGVPRVLREDSRWNQAELERAQAEQVQVKK